MTHLTDGLLREALCEDCGHPISICNAIAMKNEAVKRHGEAAVLAALAAAPKPAPDRETLVEAIRAARCEWANDGDGESCPDQSIADALLARGLRLPGGEETMAWAVVGESGVIELVYVGQDRRELAEMIAENTEGKAVPVAIRVVEGGDDAA